MRNMPRKGHRICLARKNQPYPLYQIDAKGLKEKHEENPLYKHVQTSHRNENVKFKYVPRKFFIDSLTSQIGEGVKIDINLAEQTNIMNSKSELFPG